MTDIEAKALALVNEMLNTRRVRTNLRAVSCAEVIHRPKPYAAPSNNTKPSGKR
jgi:hypothetical protein